MRITLSAITPGQGLAWAAWTDESDDAPLHHYPRSTDPMASAEELITLGVQYSARVAKLHPFFVPNPYKHERIAP